MFFGLHIAAQVVFRLPGEQESLREIGCIFQGDAYQFAGAPAIAVRVRDQGFQVGRDDGVGHGLLKFSKPFCGALGVSVGD